MEMNLLNLDQVRRSYKVRDSKTTTRNIVSWVVFHGLGEPSPQKIHKKYD